MEKIKIKLEGGIMPTKGSTYSAAYDVFCPTDFVLRVGRQTIDLGFILELPLHWKANIRPRSGFSSKGLEVERVIKFSDDTEVRETVRIDADVLLGLVDSDYRGHVGATVKVCRVTPTFNISSLFEKNIKDISYILLKGTRFAQMEICRGEDMELVETEDIDMSINRGGGYGHTGSK